MLNNIYMYIFICLDLQIKHVTCSPPSLIIWILNDIWYLLWYYMCTCILRFMQFAQYIWYTPLWIYPLTVKHISLSAKLKRTNLGISLGFGYRCCSSNLVLCYISPLHLGLGKFLLTFYSVVWNIDLIF